MRKKIMLAAASAALLSLTAVGPAAAGTFCYDLDVNVNGDQVVDESGCEELPV